MKSTKDLAALAKFLQDKIDVYDITDVQKKVCNRAIWYIIVKNYGLHTANQRARGSYGVLYSRIKTEPYVREIFDIHLGKEYFIKKNIIKNFELYKNLERNII